MDDAGVIAAADPRVARRRLLPRLWRTHGPTAIGLFPGVALFVGLFIVPLAILVGISVFEYVPGELYVKTLTLENYRRAFTDSFYTHALFNTLKLSFLTTGLSLAIAYPLALYLLKTRRAVRGLVLAIVITPLFTSVVVRAYGWTIILDDNGPLNSALTSVGLPTVDLSRNFAAVVIGMVHVELPFMLLPIYASLRRIPVEVIEAARSLGAGPLRTVFSVYLPISAPGVAAGCALVFGTTVSAFIEPSILGGPQVFLLAGVVYEEITAKLNWPQGAALGYELMLIALIVAIVMVKVGRPKWQERS